MEAEDRIRELENELDRKTHELHEVKNGAQSYRISIHLYSAFISAFLLCYFFSPAIRSAIDEAIVFPTFRTIMGVIIFILVIPLFYSFSFFISLVLGVLAPHFFLHRSEVQHLLDGTPWHEDEKNKKIAKISCLAAGILTAIAIFFIK